MKKLISVVVASLAVTAACAVEYTLIPYSSAMTAMGSSEYNAERGFVHAIDGSGLSTVNGVLVHTDSYQNKMWMSGNVTLSASAPKFYCVDLGETYLLGQIKIWNFNQSGQQSRGFKATEIYVTDNAEAAKSSPSDVRAWGAAVWTGELSKATGNNDKGCAPIEISPTRARYVAFVCTTSHGDDNIQGLSEVRFFSAPEGMPSLASTSVALNANQDGFDASATLGAGANDSELATLVYTSEEDEPLRLSLGTAAAGETKALSLATLAASTTFAVRFEAANAVASVTNKDVVCIYTGEPTLSWKSDGHEKGTVSAEVTVSRAAASPYPIDVHYSLASTDGVAGVDYVPATGVVTIPAGAASAVIAVKPIVNPDKSEDVHVTVTLEAGASYLKMQPTSVDVAIANASIPANANVWVAGASSDGLASTASNWSKGVPRADSPESLVILVDGNYSTQSMTWNADGTTDLAATVTSWMQTTEYQGTVTFKTTFPNASSSFKTFTVTGDMVVNGGAITHPVSANWDNMSSANLSLDALRESYVYRLNLAAGNFTLGAGAKIDAAGKGHSWLRKTGNVKACTPSHGGRYETTSIGCYGNPKYPEDVGLASNLGTDSLSKCAVGGGAVKLSVVGSCVINGEVTVDGTIGSGSLGAGAAGSVLIEAARVTGAGLIHADGIYGGNTGQYNGTGGRIALLTTEAVDMTTLTVRAGGSATGKYAPEGTVYLKDASMTHGVLCLNNPLYTSSNATPNRGAFVTDEEGVDWTFDAIRLNGHVNLYVTEGTTLTLPNGFASVTAPDNTSRVSGIYYRGGTLDVGTGNQTIGGGMWYFYPSVRYPFAANLTVDDGAAIGSCSYWEVPAIANSAAPTSAWKVLFSVAGNMTIGTNGAVTANTAGLGQQSGTQYAGVVIGAHGGRRTATGATMDSVFNPHVPGVFQSNSYGYVKAGGVIDFTVGGLLTLDGKILSDAPDTADGGRGNASGGAINISAGTIAGAGPISAAAKRDVQCGGRIAVKLTGSGATFADYTGSLCAKSGGNTTAASAGSVYLQGGAEADKTGVIIIDNFNNGGLTTPICATGYEADAADDFKKASLVVRNKGYAQVAVVNEKGEFKMKEIEICANSKLDLYGKNFIVQKATLNGTRLAPGVYKASDYPESLADSLGTDGTLQVSGSGLKFIIR